MLFDATCILSITLSMHMTCAPWRAEPKRNDHITNAHTVMLSLSRPKEITSDV